MSFWKKIFNWRKKKLDSQEETLKIIGALTVMELNNSRSFRRKIEKTEYGRKLKQIVNY